jgi:hypothetical protein
MKKRKFSLSFLVIFLFSLGVMAGPISKYADPKYREIIDKHLQAWVRKINAQNKDIKDMTRFEPLFNDLKTAGYFTSDTEYKLDIFEGSGDFTNHAGDLLIKIPSPTGVREIRYLAKGESGQTIVDIQYITEKDSDPFTLSLYKRYGEVTSADKIELY